MTVASLIVDSPLGALTITERDGAIATIRIAEKPAGDEPPSEQHAPPHATPVLARAQLQLAEYFAGTRTAFDLPLAPPASPFQGRMRAAMCAIPYGETRSYGALAETVGSVARAVGQGCGDNPIPIVVPCHRVLAAGGGIGGFSAAGGITTKRWLLAHETRFHPREDDLFAHAR